MKKYNTHYSLSIEEKVILVTGAFGLIGQTVAISFLQQGAQVILADGRKQWKARSQGFLMQTVISF